MTPVFSAWIQRSSWFAASIAALIAGGCGATGGASALPARASQPAAAPGAGDSMPTVLPHAAELTSRLREALRSGTGAEKERALNIIGDLRAIVMIPELIDTVDDPTPSPRDGDTGWGFTGHHAASILGQIAFVLDGVPIEKRGRDEFSFQGDMYHGGEALRAAGRLKQVQDNWAAWWTEFRKHS